MADRPIVFSGPMVRALWADRKTQTRRLCKDQPPAGVTIIRKTIRPFGKETFHAFERRTKFGNFGGEVPVEIKRGDHVWVREGWRTEIEIEQVRACNVPPHSPIEYLAGGVANMPARTVTFAGRRRASMHMPRWASRMTLIITDVRIERLQDISDADAIAEGIEQSKKFPDRYLTPAGDYAVPKVAYQRLWEAINGPGSWEANPWIVAYTFRVIKQNIDQIEREAA